MTDTKLAITTLSCNDRQVLFKTIRSFVDNTVIDYPLTWYILLQGYSPQAYKTVKKFTDKLMHFNSNLTFNLTYVAVNKGLSAGVNYLAQLSQHFTYVIHLEDDWICLPEEFTGIPKEWLKQLISFMDTNPQMSSIFLRKYSTPQEKYHYCWTRPAQYVCHRFVNFNYSHQMRTKPKVKYQQLTLQEIPNFCFTLNPVLRRNQDYYRAEVFPLDQFDDKASDSRRQAWSTTAKQDIPHWGWAESLAMEKIRHLTAYNLHAGLFGHYDDWSKLPKFQAYDKTKLNTELF